MSVKKCLTQKEIENFISELNAIGGEEEHQGSLNSNTCVVYIPPPNVGEVTDEEDINDEELMTDNPPNLEVCGEIEIEYDSHTSDFAAPRPSVASKEVLPLAQRKYSLESNFGVPKWKKSKRIDLNFTHPEESAVAPLQNKIVESMSGKSPIELFLQYFDNEIIYMLLKNSNIYAQQKNISVVITKEHLYRFIGILILSGYHTVPHIQHYWSSQPSLGVPIVKQSLSRNMFQKIKQAFHIIDNNEMEVSDRFAKVRPLIDTLNRKYQQYGMFSTYLSIDEQMIPYFGRHNCKMFIRGKPIRFGFKYWCLCSDTGYLFEAHPYAGAGSSYDKTVGLEAIYCLFHCLIAKEEGTKQLSQINFKAEIATKLLFYVEKPNDEHVDMIEGSQHLPRPNVREHVVCKIQGNKRKRCRECHSQAVYQCKKCNITLHPKCFEGYHLKIGKK